MTITIVIAIIITIAIAIAIAGDDMKFVALISSRFVAWSISPHSSRSYPTRCLILILLHQADPIGVVQLPRILQTYSLPS